MGPFANILEYLRVYRRYIGRRIYLVFLLTGLAAVTEGLGITLLLPLLRASETAGGDMPTGTVEQTLFEFLQWLGVADSMVGILIFIGVAFVLKALVTFAKGGYQGYLQSQLFRELKGGLFDAYCTMNYRHYISRNTGHFINVINGQVGRFFNSFSSFADFLSAIITTTSYMVIAFMLTWRFALMAVVAGLVILLMFKTLSAYVRRLSRRVSQETSQLNKLLVQALQSFKYIVSTNQVKHLRSGVTGSIDKLTADTFRQRLAGAFTQAIREPTSILFILVIIAIQVSVFNEPVAPIFVSIILFHRAMQSIIGIQGSWQKVMDMIGGVEMVTDEFDELRERREASGETKVGALSDSIVFDDLSFAYDEEEGNVLDSINLTIPANTSVAFVGESGAGKSTLVDVLTLMLRPRTGEIRIDGVSGRDVDLASWRNQIGYVSQETVMFDDTVANNICLWRGDYADDADLRGEIQEAAQEAYADHFIRELPDGYQTVIGDRGVRLSGGQRQRMFVARELFKRPNLLILDEATSALDTESERYIQESIDALKGKMTVVIIAHRLSTIKNVDYVYVLDDGVVVEEGTYGELRTHEESRFREMVEMQSL